ncbi:MAG: response regulator [Verrucomicrobiota bacterium]|nr:response regulator [Verrucomicrobiota bacterium]
MHNPNATILLAEDNEDDVIFIRRAFRRAEVLNPIQRVQDGEEAIAYLSGAGIYADREKYPFPAFILTDLKMPRKNGLEVLHWIKENPLYRVVPMVMLSSSNHEEDVRKAYDLGANAYHLKPVNYEELPALLKRIYDYWSSTEKLLPRKKKPD